nr:hypothetical protein N619_00225 [Ipomoea batatas]
MLDSKATGLEGGTEMEGDGAGGAEMDGKGVQRTCSEERRPAASGTTKRIVVAKMAQVHIVKVFLFAVVLAVFSAAATAQDIGSAPTPSPDAGAAFSLLISSAVIGTSPLVPNLHPSSVSGEQGSSCGGVLSLVNGSWSAAAELSSDIVTSLSRSDGNNGVEGLPCFRQWSSSRWLWRRVLLLAMVLSFSDEPTKATFFLSVTKQRCGEAPAAGHSGDGDVFPLFSPSLLLKLAAGSEVVR